MIGLSGEGDRKFQLRFLAGQGAFEHYVAVALAFVPAHKHEFLAAKEIG